MGMKNILYILFLFVSISSMAQKDDFDSGIELYDTSEELVPLRKNFSHNWKMLSIGKSDVKTIWWNVRCLSSSK